VGKVVTALVLVVIVVYAVFPIAWTLLNSFKDLRDIITPVPKLIFRPTLQNYQLVVRISDISAALLRSLIVSSSSVVLGFILGAPFAFVIARYKFIGRDQLKFWIITLRMMPPVAAVFAFVYLWIRLGLMDTYFALIVTYLLITIPTIIWLSIEPFRNVPIEVEEAAQLEGCTPAQVFFNFALPIAWPNLIGGVLFSFILVWNEYFMAFALTSRNMTMPVAVGAFTVVGMQIDWGQVSASVILLCIPPLVLAGMFRKSLASYFVIKA
jgi:multiple sugar transport system permease protein